MNRLMVGLLVWVLMLGSCASIPKNLLSAGDLPSLKGRWEGTRDVSLGKQQIQSYMEMEIYNDSLPLKGQVQIEMAYEKVLRSYPFENGMINDQGNLFVRLADDLALDLSYFPTEGKNKLAGHYNYKQAQGVVTLFKK
jgi:hypothetical protein